jgi:hypothetical protein
MQWDADKYIIEFSFGMINSSVIVFHEIPVWSYMFLI